ncbi:MAG TPA: PadR family transcriptional regulator [Mycobacteriales bacterium]|jgi:DNA-binding PadR family transcriptional regulator|nr:PadR family transcriptional regulator [Mycobacteriales bacterium]
MVLPQTLLGLLEPAPRHGYDLKREYDAAFGAQHPVKRAQVYATLGRLLRDGEITVVGVDRVDGPDRTSYALTSDGVTHLERWLAEPEPVTPYLQSVVYTKVVLALRSGRPADRILHSQRAAHLAVMRELTERKRGADLATTLACDFTLFHLEADVRWVEHTAARLDRLAGELT